jgi:protein-S-isoprenylcysteine O-methyltransferase Ste14
MKKLLPPVLFLIFLFLMAGICWALGSPHTVSYPYNLVGALLLCSGLGIAIYHSRLFKKEGANIMTFGEPTKFVRSGLYKHSRNPMYLGFVVALLGAAFLYQAALSSILLVILFWFIADRWYIRFEETEMLKNFGEDYREYCRQTPRWLGRV